MTTSKMNPKKILEVRMRVMITIAHDMLKHNKEFPPAKHLWFPRNGDYECYELRKGNAPSDSKRPDYLKGIPLWIDILALPDHIVEACKPGNFMDEQVKAQLHVLSMKETNLIHLL